MLAINVTKYKTVMITNHSHTLCATFCSIHSPSGSINSRQILLLCEIHFLIAEIYFHRCHCTCLCGQLYLNCKTSKTMNLLLIDRWFSLGLSSVLPIPPSRLAFRALARTPLLLYPLWFLLSFEIMGCMLLLSPFNMARSVDGVQGRIVCWTDL